MPLSGMPQTFRAHPCAPSTLPLGSIRALDRLDLPSIQSTGHVLHPGTAPCHSLACHTPPVCIHVLPPLGTECGFGRGGHVQEMQSWQFGPVVALLSLLDCRLDYPSLYMCKPKRAMKRDDSKVGARR